jgi:hypothetical protein
LAAHPPNAPTDHIAAFDPTLKRRDFDVIGVARHVNDSLVPIRVVEAIGDQVMHTLLAHIAQGHRWAGRVFHFHKTPVLVKDWVPVWLAHKGSAKQWKGVVNSDLG